MPAQDMIAIGGSPAGVEGLATVLDGLPRGLNRVCAVTDSLSRIRQVASLPHALVGASMRCFTLGALEQ
jgi:hypothetical protein